MALPQPRRAKELLLVGQCSCLRFTPDMDSVTRILKPSNIGILK
jgi:hypothetical protein